jgi:hypothetical protein
MFQINKHGVCINPDKTTIYSDGTLHSANFFIEKHCGYELRIVYYIHRREGAVRRTKVKIIDGVECYYCPKCSKHLEQEKFHPSRTSNRPVQPYCIKCTLKYLGEIRDASNRVEKKHYGYDFHGAIHGEFKIVRFSRVIRKMAYWVGVTESGVESEFSKDLLLEGVDKNSGKGRENG